VSWGKRLFPVNRWLEWLLALGVVAGLAWSIIHVWLYGYLPQPYFYEPQDVWMDWFNTAYWAHQPGAYDSWLTIYPPLSFAVLKPLTWGPCYAGAEGYSSRSCDWYGAATLLGVYALNWVLTARTFLKIDRRTAWPRTIALCAGLPMTYGLERGNLILLCFTCVLLAYGPLVRSARLRWFFAACAVNFKVYLIGTLFAQLLRRRWRWFEGAALTTVLVYLVTFALVGAGTPAEIYRNISDFSGGYQAVTVLDLWYTSTFKPLVSLLTGSTFPIISIIGSQAAEIGAIAIPALVHFVQGCIVLAAAAAAFRPEVVPMHRLVFLSIAMALITSEAGGYTQILLILFVFMERWKGFGRAYAIFVAYVLCIAGDIPIDRVPPIAQDSFLSGGRVIAHYNVGVGPFLRPLLILSLPFALSMVTLRAVYLRLREEGWRLPRLGYVRQGRRASEA
jgi:hypothetical protein